MKQSIQFTRIKIIETTIKIVIDRNLSLMEK